MFHVYEQHRLRIPVSTTTFLKHSMSFPFTADNFTGVAFRFRPSVIHCDKIVIETSMSVTKFETIWCQPQIVANCQLLIQFAL